MKHRTVQAATIIILCICHFALGCSSEDKNNSLGSENPLRVLAKNVIFRPSTADAATAIRAAGAVDTTTQVLAENVVIETADNSLTSGNLQSALDNELAIKLSAYLPGTTWKVANKTSDATYSGTEGSITFSTGMLTVNSGRLAAAGIVAAAENHEFCMRPLAPITYELISDGVMYVTWNGQPRIISQIPPEQQSTTPQPQDATITVVARSKDKLVLVGTGGCGAQGAPRISVLTRVP